MCLFIFLLYLFQVRFSNEFYDTKKRSRKLSDEVYALVDVGNDAPNAPPLDQCVETEVSSSVL